MRTIHKDGCGGEVKSMARQAKRPPPVSKGVANDLYQKGPRSAMMLPREPCSLPPFSWQPTKDTRYTTRKG